MERKIKHNAGRIKSAINQLTGGTFIKCTKCGKDAVDVFSSTGTDDGDPIITESIFKSGENIYIAQSYPCMCNACGVFEYYSVKIVDNLIDGV